MLKTALQVEQKEVSPISNQISHNSQQLKTTTLFTVLSLIKMFYFYSVLLSVNIAFENLWSISSSLSSCQLSHPLKLLVKCFLKQVALAYMITDIKRLYTFNLNADNQKLTIPLMPREQLFYCPTISLHYWVTLFIIGMHIISGIMWIYFILFLFCIVFLAIIVLSNIDFIFPISSCILLSIGA